MGFKLSHQVLLNKVKSFKKKQTKRLSLINVSLNYESPFSNCKKKECQFKNKNQTLQFHCNLVCQFLSNTPNAKHELQANQTVV